MTSNDAAALSRPYGRHAAPRGTARTAPSTKGPGRHAAPGGRLPLADVAETTEAPEPRPLATRAPLAALVALFALLLLAVTVGTLASNGAAALVEAPSVAVVDQVEPQRLPLDLAEIPGNVDAAPVADWSSDTATDEPAGSCGDYCGTDAGQTATPAGALPGGAVATAPACLTRCTH